MKRVSCSAVSQRFRDGRETADIAEHQGKLPDLASQLQLLRVRGQPLDQGRGQVTTERGPDTPALTFSQQVLQGARGQMDRDGAKGGIEGVEEEPRLLVGEPGCAPSGRGDGHADESAHQRPRKQRVQQHEQDAQGE